MKKILLIFLVVFFLVKPLSAEIIDNGDSTLTDTATGLMWWKYASDYRMTPAQSQAYIGNLNYGKYNNWRLPNQDEIRDIISHMNISSGYYLSSQIAYEGTSYCYDAGYSLTVFCQNGSVIVTRNPQLTSDKIYTQAQMDEAIAAERWRWDIDRDGKIGMAEAINALQTISGMRR